MATLEPPHSWAVLPEHRDVQVVADVDGRVLPQEQESDISALHLFKGEIGTYWQILQQRHNLWLDTKRGRCLES